MSRDSIVELPTGVSLFTRTIGDGSPVVVLHGGPGASHDYLRPGFDVLAERHSLIYYDQRGGGQSPVPRDVPVGCLTSEPTAPSIVVGNDVGAVHLTRGCDA